MTSVDCLLVWSDEYSVGDEILDAEHRVMFACMNRLWSVMVRNAEDAELGPLLKQLQLLALGHFEREERLLVERDDPDRVAHFAEHAAFLARLDAARHAHATGQAVCLAMWQFLREWVASHLALRDRHSLGAVMAPPLHGTRGRHADALAA